MSATRSAQPQEIISIIILQQLRLSVRVLARRDMCPRSPGAPRFGLRRRRSVGVIIILRLIVFRLRFLLLLRGINNNPRAERISVFPGASIHKILCQSNRLGDREQKEETGNGLWERQAVARMSESDHW